MLITAQIDVELFQGFAFEIENPSLQVGYDGMWGTDFHLSKKSPAGPTERNPKPEYRISLATYLGVRW